MEKQIKHIINKATAQNASESEKKELLALFHLPEAEFKLKNILVEELQNKSSSENASPDMEKLFAKFWVKVNKSKVSNKPKPAFLPAFLKFAAVLVFGLFIGFYITSIKTRQEPVYYAAHSPRGSVSEMILPDGSIIFLNSDSKIKYSIEGKEGIREVFLNGEAWFQVEKNMKEPFVVHTPYYDVNVTGTRFNVKAYDTDNEIATTLEEGEVVISSSVNLKLAFSPTLKPGEQLVLNKYSKKMTIKTVNTKWFTSWKDNKLIFVNMSLKELIVVLERKYGVDIDVKNKAILDYHYDGTIKNETIIEILEIIKNTLPISYEIVGQKIEITAKKI